MKKSIIPITICILLISLSTCDTLAEIGAATGVIDSGQAESLKEAGEAMGKAGEEFTPENEYYIGRSVGASILADYKPYNVPKANAYINLLGQSLSVLSDMPETFKGYYFLILDSDDINAFACPSGHVFITRGLIKCAGSEDMLAAILAHEIGHVEKKHGMESIDKARKTEAILKLAKAATEVAGSQELKDLTNVFDKSIEDIVKTLVVNGYSREFEYEADKASVKILVRAGYDPNAAVEMLAVMDKKLKPGGLDFAKTHPDPKDRISRLKKEIGGKKAENTPTAERQKRYNNFMALIK